ncbi:MAG: hypothetical protein ACE5FL_15965, partial [Myxococcota bacterium]
MSEPRPDSEGPSRRATDDPGAPGALDRLASFRVVYAAIFTFVVLSVVTVSAAEFFLTRHLTAEVDRAIRVSPADGPVVPQIQTRVSNLIRYTAWTRLGGVDFSAIVIGADSTILYSGGRSIPPPPTFDPIAIFREAQRVLPASAETFVAVPMTSVLAIGIIVSYGTVLITGLFFHARRESSREEALIQSAMAARDVTARRADEIEAELEQIRMRLLQVEPAEQAQAREIHELQNERVVLHQKLADLAEREQKLRASAERSIELNEEHRALEELLEEAVEDLGTKDSEIQTLQSQLKRAAKAPPAGGRNRGSELVARRLRTLYKNLEVDDRAVNDLVALRDEIMKLKAEEGIKRLADESDNAAIRRKVGGLPAQLSIFELGFAGKGRIYYTRGRQQRFRILAIGAKNTQKADIEYLSRL